MSVVLVPVLVALVASLAVLAVALRLSVTTQDWRPVRDLRAGLRRGRGGPGVLSGARRELAAAADAGADDMEELLALAPTGQGYVTTEEIASRLGRGARRRGA